MAEKRASVIMEALPYIKKFQGKTFVIKFGGSIMNNEASRTAFMENVALLKLVGINIVIVHGGGPNINTMLERLDIKPEFRHGLRVTDKEVMEIAEMTLSGQVNKTIAGELSLHGIKAIGLSGRDSNLVTAKQYKIDVDGKEEDFGYVGEVDHVNAELLEDLLDKGFLPVVSPIASDAKGYIYNVNADYVAAAVASALKAEKLFLLTDTEGLYKDQHDPTTLIHGITTSEIKGMIEDGSIAGGMIPKMESCMKSITDGTKSIYLIDGRKIHSLLLEVFTDEGTGTEITL